MKKRKSLKRKIYKNHDVENLKTLEAALEKFLNEEMVEKDSPTSSSVHVPSTDWQGPTDDERKTQLETGAVPPTVANLGTCILKDVNGDNDDVGLYDMQSIVEGTDWEAANQTNGDEEQAYIYAMDNLANDPDYYRKKQMEENSTDDQLALTKDTEENEEASESGWPIGLNLHLGSAHAREPGHVGIDSYPYDKGTYVHDLSLGIPADDSSVAKILMSGCFEKMNKEDQKTVLSEIQRVLMPEGQFVYEGPNDIWNYPDWVGKENMRLLEQEESGDDDSTVAKSKTFRTRMERIAIPDPATSDDAEPRIGVAQYDQLPADALLAMDALGYYWSDSTSSGRGNRLHGYPSQGALVDRGDVARANKTRKSKLTTEGRDKIKDSNFALPKERKYPIPDLSHARNALARSSGKPEEKTVRAAVYRKYPDLNPVNKVRKTRIGKADKMKQVAYCVVLSPEELDAQDDWMTADDIEDTAHNYMMHSRVIGKDHSDPIDAVPVESYIAPQDLNWEDGPHGPQTVKKGSWILGIKILDPKEWDKVQSGDYQGVSVGGMGVRE